MDKEDSGSGQVPGFDLPPPSPPEADAGGLCGNLIVPIVSDALNLYFILDMSGSMHTPMPDQISGGVLPYRYEAARSAMQSVLRAVGHRVSYGAAWFPEKSNVDGCIPGDEFFATRAGDTQSFAVTKQDGPVLKKFLTTFDQRTPFGGTPTAATIEALRPKVRALTGKTFAFLLTDGAPNCAPTPCDKDRCTVNIEKACSDPKINCCDPSFGEGNEFNCLDDDATVAAIAALKEDGVSTFVIGMPGSDEYVDVLDRAATAGGTARETSPYYYPVKTSSALADTLKDIGLAVSISCDVAFATPPPDKNLVNVFFDRTVVPLDPENGWTWNGDDHVVLVGEACAKLKNGDVGQVQVVAGCPSIAR